MKIKLCKYSLKLFMFEKVICKLVAHVNMEDT
jgi:hypothetical protein